MHKLRSSARERALLLEIVFDGSVGETVFSAVGSLRKLE